jgi:hypothetical protein
MKLLILTLLAAPLQVPERITFVEVYGAERVGEGAVRDALGMRDGDPMPTGPTGARQRLLALPGVAAVDLNSVCCAADGGALIYVGVAAEGEPRRTYRPAPAGDVRLPEEVTAAGAELERALLAAVQRGVIEEDESEGHSLLSDPAARAIQRRLQEAAAAHADLLARVLHESADDDQRALAAQIIAYAGDKRAILPLLLDALDDPAEGVRNNASRALGLIARHGARNPQLGIVVDPAPFIAMLTAHVWTDRNKAAAALLSLTESRDPPLLERLRAEALDPLVEMARWRHEGHALGAFIMLGRLAGLDDAVSFAAFAAGERERVIAAALSAHAPVPAAPPAARP